MLVPEDELTAAPELELARACPYRPNAQHVRVRDAARPVRMRLPSGMPVWAVAGHRGIRAVLADDRFSADRQRQGFPFAVDGQPGAFRRTMISMDGAEHRAARSAVAGEFTVRRVRQLRPRIDRIVHECLDALLAGPKPADLVRALALPVPSRVICEQLGVPYSDHDFFQTRSTTMLLRTATAPQRLRAIDELLAALETLIAEKEAAPSEDLLGRQIRKGREDGEYRRTALVRMAFLLLVAGHETTANMISLGALNLAERPLLAAALRADPARAPLLVEELLRRFTIAEFIPTRVATEDVHLDGERIAAGEVVVLLCNAADHDPAVFPGPRRGARDHLAFGHGPHQCLGQQLARTELEIVYTALATRLPGLRAAVPARRLRFKTDAEIYGIHEFPVTW
ncbi:MULTISPECIES: cytochrome P450 [Amycolatopsis]|uniref:cytochrome P450 n=1 Tax=Amycolatopsis TaxID=1813 RepID=UPI0007E1FF4D|nr:cytochrome P450 [Amycolatopsis sp. M39]OAP20681.1 Cytochrome P450 105A3 [Amycolatopsis sp. M39]